MNFISNLSWSQRLMLLFGIIIVVCIVAIIWIAIVFTLAPNTIPLEIVKSLLQVLTASVLGQVVSLSVAQFNTDRQKAEARAEYQKSIYTKLINCYVVVKKHRRLLRAKGLIPPYTGDLEPNTEVLFDPYDEHMQFVNDAELDLEAIWREIKASPKGFSDSEYLAAHVESMKDYLRAMISLYERKRSSFTGKPKKLGLSDLCFQSSTLPKMFNQHYSLDDFVRRPEGTVFEEGFIDQYHKALEAIQKDMLK